MRYLGVLTICFLTLVPAGAQADTITAGNYVKFEDGVGTTGGGEFLLKVYTTPGGSVVDQFITFCLQMTESMNFTDTFRVGGVSTAADDQPTADPLDQRTAYLYTQFRNGTLEDYVAGTIKSANQLQKAIWYFEGENVGDVTTNKFVQAANEAIANGLWSGLGNVKVVNLFNQNGTRAQDQLTIVPPTTVPEPSTMALLGSGIVALCLRRRRTVA